MPVRYRRSPYLVVYWKSGDLIFCNYATGEILSAEAATAQILSCFDDWRSAAAVYERFREFSRSSFNSALNELARTGLLERSDRRTISAQKAMKYWEHWNPAAGFFHFSTKDTQFVTDPREMARYFKTQVKPQPLPNPLKRNPKAPQIQLPEVAASGEFPSTLLARRTWREFGRGPVSIAQLATLLRLTFGVQHWIDVPNLGRAALKTSPSGGARHPTEVYVLAQRVDGLRRGLYHYAADAHRLERLRSGAGRGDIARVLPGQKWYRPAAAVFLFTAVFPRSQWKYHAPRAYRAVLIESGHFCQTFLLTATWLGLAPFCTMALADTRAEKYLGIDGVTESVIYAAGVGTRPAGVEWARWPAAMGRPGSSGPEKSRGKRRAT